MGGNILLTGKPGVGKTTLIRRLLAHGGWRAGGFFTEEVRAGGQRTGFRLVTLDGREALLASARPAAWRPRVGRYTVHLESLEELAIPALQEALAQAELIVIDEIGKMELLAPAFRPVVLACLDAAKPLLATIGVGQDATMRAIRARPDVTLIEVTPANRDRLVHEVAARLRQSLAG
jgi:nucleoside-triphosphatase